MVDTRALLAPLKIIRALSFVMLETGWEFPRAGDLGVTKFYGRVGGQAEECSTPAWNLQGQIAEFLIWTPLALDFLCTFCFRVFQSRKLRLNSL